MSTAVEGNRQSNWRGTSFCEVDLTKFKAIDIPSHRFIPLTSDHMNISKLKVKPRRQQHVQACALELSTMLGCWASYGDVTSTNQCKDAAKRLHECMAKPQIGGKARVSSINYHLSRL